MAGKKIEMVTIYKGGKKTTMEKTKWLESKKAKSGKSKTKS